jgi:TldD protein
MLLLFSLMVPSEARADPTIELLAGEIDRVFEALEGDDDAPYFLAYQITETGSWRVAASAGALGRASYSEARLLDLDVRVGSPERDNTHEIRDAPWYSEDFREEVALPIDGDERATLNILWRETDDAWRSAVRRLAQVKANEAVKVEREEEVQDFFPAQPVQDLLEVPELEPDVAAWAARLAELSEVFLAYPDIHESGAELSVEREVRWMVNSEGTQLRVPRTHWRVALWANTTAEDGMRLSVYDASDAHTAAGLPDQSALLADAEALAEQLVGLREAPLLEPYTGPAILRGRAAGVFFHEVFGHRIEGHRQQSEDEGQTFKDMVGEPILPGFLSVRDDPTAPAREGVDLNGWYAYDDEGVPAEDVLLVEDGELRTFLLSRKPVSGTDASNGHGRRQPGNAIVPRQGNLMIEASETVPYDELRAQLVEQIRAQGKPFGLIVDDIEGGFTFTGRVVPNSFNVRPISAWRVYADGRPDELVRGGDLIGTPLVTFSRILAAGDDVAVFNGVCGAESGWVPVSASSPSLLLQEIEVQRKEKESDRPPLLLAPERAPADGSTDGGTDGGTGGGVPAGGER